MPNFKRNNPQLVRAARILNLATNLQIKNDGTRQQKQNDETRPSHVPKRNISSNGCLSNQKRKKSYSELYDEGNWEELDHVLRKGIHEKKQIHSKILKREPWGEEYKTSKLATSFPQSGVPALKDVLLQGGRATTSAIKCNTPQSVSLIPPVNDCNSICTGNIIHIDKMQVINHSLTTPQDLSSDLPSVQPKVPITNNLVFDCTGRGYDTDISTHCNLPSSSGYRNNKHTTSEFFNTTSTDFPKEEEPLFVFNDVGKINLPNTTSEYVPQMSNSKNSCGFSTNNCDVILEKQLPVQDNIQLEPVLVEDPLHTYACNGSGMLSYNFDSIRSVNIEKPVDNGCVALTTISNEKSPKSDCKKTYAVLTNIQSVSLRKNNNASWENSPISLAHDKTDSSFGRCAQVSEKNEVCCNNKNNTSSHQANNDETIPSTSQVNEKSSSHIPNNKPSKRVRRCDRRNYCLFCNNLVLNFRRHLINNHKKELVVAEYIALLESCKEESKEKRAKMIEQLTLQGNHMYNEMLLTNASEEISVEHILPVKRPPKTKKIKSSQYVTCTICHGLFVRKHYYEHASKCKKQYEDSNKNVQQPEIENQLSNDESNDETCIERNKTPYLKMHAKTFCKKTKNVSKEMEQNVFSVLRQDDIGKKAMGDSFLVSLASDFYASHSDFKDRTQVTRKLRDGVKLVEEVKSMDPEIKSLSDLFQPTKVNIVIEACKNLCNINTIENSNKPAVVGMNGRLSWIIEEGCKKLIDDIICSDTLTLEQKQERKRQVKYFHECIRRRWKFSISTNLEKNRRRTKIVKDTIMPLDEDIKLFVSMLRDMEKEYLEKFEHDVQNITIKEYETICKVTISHILTLNRRRPFEATHSEIEFYLKKISNNDDCQKDIINSLAEEERVSMNELSSYIVPAKGIEAVATILLTKQMEKCIEIIIKARKVFKMTGSKYLFPRPGLNTLFDGSKVLRELKSMCRGLKKPEHMTATGLRHHVATIGHVKGPDFTSKLSQFMCHTQSVHDKNYVAPINVIHKGVIGNYLTSLEGTSFDNSKISNCVPEEVTNTVAKQLSADKVELQQTNAKRKTIRNIEEEYIPDTNVSDTETSANEEDSPKKIKKETHVKRRWTIEEKGFVINKFSEYITSGTNPGICKARELIQTSGTLLKHRTPQQINTLIDNLNKGKLKLPSNFLYLKKK